MSGELKQIVDALATALNATAGVPDLTLATFKYYRPLSVSGPAGAQVPALSVAPSKTAPEPMATDGSYQETETILVTYYAGQMSAMLSGAADATLAGATLDVVDAYKATLRGLYAGFPAITAFQTEVTLGDVHYGPIQGGIYVAEIHVNVTHWE